MSEKDDREQRHEEKKHKQRRDENCRQAILAQVEDARFRVCGVHTCVHGVTSYILRRDGDIGRIVARVDDYLGTFNVRVWGVHGWQMYFEDLPRVEAFSRSTPGELGRVLHSLWSAHGSQ